MSTENKPENPPAFPTSQVEDPRCGVLQYAQPGMPLRDYFAAATIPALFPNEMTDELHEFIASEMAAAGFTTLADYWASKAYKMADAMLKARIQ